MDYRFDYSTKMRKSKEGGGVLSERSLCRICRTDVLDGRFRKHAKSPARRGFGFYGSIRWNKRCNKITPTFNAVLLDKLELVNQENEAILFRLKSKLLLG